MNNIFSNESNASNKNQNNAENMRDAMKTMSCIRQIANWSKMENKYKFDKKEFDPNEFYDNILTHSPKMNALFQKIIDLDEKDMKKDGKLYKHFIYTDIKELGYGAKILASGFVSMGYNCLIRPSKSGSLKLSRPKEQKNVALNEREDNFLLLCSTSIYEQTFTVALKNKIIQLFNFRPTNIHGDLARFIILDSGYKEGIDLFDVKYVHIFEPSLTTGDLQQTIGRATRLCGQKGLPFQDKIGWPLYVYHYTTIIPEVVRNTFSDVFKHEKLFEKVLEHSPLEKGQILLGNQLNELAHFLSVDYHLTHNIHPITPEYILEMKKPSKPVDVVGGDIGYIACDRELGKRHSKDNPITTDLLIDTFKKMYPSRVKEIPKSKKTAREYLGEVMKTDSEFCDKVNVGLTSILDKVPQLAKYGKGLKEKLYKDPKKELEYVDKLIHKTKSTKKIKDIPRKLGKNRFPTKQYKFDEVHEFVKQNYKDLIYDPIKPENQCISSQGQPKRSVIDLTHSQKFVSEFFTPQSSYKGLLLWHTVGTGKTCTAVATLSRTFERKDYTILWVTRTTLKNSIWKNFFEQVCHYAVAEKIKKQGSVPDEFDKQKKLLSKKVLDPISYKQFSNALMGKNELGKKLRELNGEEDPLKNTLVIFDEAHNLYNKSLSESEKPKVKKIEEYIQKSYETSKKNSAKILLMSATPFLNSPMDLFKLVNLCKTKKYIPVKYEEFKMKYINPDTNYLSQRGLMELADQCAGHISYLNRSKDISQFANIISYEIPVELSHTDDVELRKMIFLKKKDFGAKVRQIQRELNEDIEQAKQIENKTERTQQLKELRNTLRRTNRLKEKAENELDLINQEMALYKRCGLMEYHNQSLNEFKELEKAEEKAEKARIMAEKREKERLRREAEKIKKQRIKDLERYVKNKIGENATIFRENEKNNRNGSQNNKNNGSQHNKNLNEKNNSNGSQNKKNNRNFNSNVSK